MKNWKKNSWRKYPVKHIPEYPNKKELDTVLDKIGTFPPLVFAGETRHLKDQLADVVDGKAFLLQGGDCAESFAEFNPDNIRDTFKLMLQMSLVLTYSASLPVVKVGRIAGQFSKPRSSPLESKDGVELPSYLGDNINGMEFNEKSRVPDPKRLFKAYSQSAATLNLIRAFCHGGFADLKNVHNWNLGFIKNSPALKRFKDLEDKIADALAFMDACGINSDFNRRLKTVNFWTSHEALLLPFEETMTRTDSTTGENHDTSAHFVWIGDRTRQLDGGHVEFCRGIKNPIGIKCGPTLKPEDLINLCNKINPTNEKGKITLISRFGADNVSKHLPKLIRAIKKEGLNVIWSCDPCHGNTIKATKSKIESLQLKCDITYLCVYSTNKTKRLVDISFEILDGHRIFEWNALHRPEVSNYAFDLDGVLCVDPSSQQNDDGPNYLDFIVSAKPKFLPTYEIGCIVTSRLEKYRDQTEEWLRKNNVVYGALYMLDLPNAETRRKLGVHASFKAEVYQELENFLFVESDASQAYDIAKISGKFALCLNNQELYGPGLTKQRAMQRSRSLLRRIRQKLYLS